MHRNYFIAILSSLILLTTTGCLTEKYYESDRVSRIYQETIDYFLITEDGSKLVVMGEKYHYIFESSPNLKKVLFGSFRPMVKARFKDFYVTTNNNISGDYILYLDKDASDEQRRSAIDAGFIYDDTTEDYLSGHLEGIRYSAEGFPSIAQRYKFNEPHYVNITEEQSASQLAGKILITPILVLADGVLMLGGAVLYLFAIGCGGCG